MLDTKTYRRIQRIADLIIHHFERYDVTRPQETSIIDVITVKYLTCRFTNYFLLPPQVFPSPLYPALQVQIYDPRVLEQLALTSHTGGEALHSSMSKKNKNIGVPQGSIVSSSLTK